MIKQNDLAGATRMVPLLDSLISSEDEKQVLGMMLHKFYWTRFTGLSEPLARDDEEPSEGAPHR